MVRTAGAGARFLGSSCETPTGESVMRYNILAPDRMPPEDVMDVPQNRYDEIVRAIHSADSPVGIDATKTHVIIIHKLIEIERRLAALESGRPDAG